ncbi:MAG TPA: hotdog fold domain-containing protein [Nevskiaceae bacterium]|nr:hotdog fold domain-containing protein [Nevskiaceae bacterium]
MTDLIAVYQRLSRLPGGKRLFSLMVARQAPYFRTIRPTIEALSPGHCEVSMPKRRAVHNHIGTVHAIACCNLCEVAAGLMIEASLPRALRWIPKGMTVRYLKKAETDLHATVSLPMAELAQPGDRVLPVVVRDRRGQIVVEADITMYVSARPSPSST